MPKWATDFHTTMVFTTISVCSLDFALTISFALGSRRQVLYTFPPFERAWLGVGLLFTASRSPNLTSYI